MAPRTATGQGRLTAQDVARFCDVDLKTIHHWVAKDKLAGSRTPGGHLRFDITAVVDFLRLHGYPIPKELAGRRARIALVLKNRAVRDLARKALGRRFELIEYEAIVDLAVDFQPSRPEALVADPGEGDAGLAPVVRRLRQLFPQLRVVYFGAPVAEDITCIPHATPGLLRPHLEGDLGCA
jgi:hypothetical protein